MKRMPADGPPSIGPPFGLRRVLFLSGSLGKGHDALADACTPALRARGVETNIVDCMALLGSGPAAVGRWVFTQLVASPLYDAFHFGLLRGDGGIGAAADRASAARMYPALQRRAEAFAPELVVPVFATGVRVAARLKRDGICSRIAVFLPDSMAHRMWVDETVDLFLVTSPLAAASVRRYWPEAPIRIVGMPVRPEFHRAPPQAAARAALGVPADATCVLLMAGAWGMAPLDGIAASLADAGHWVLAVGGTNARLSAKLRAVALHHPTVVSLGFSDRVPELMAASDVVVTTSGATCYEARAVGRMLVLLDVVPGHGRENLQHHLEMGGAAVATPTPDGVTRAVGVVLRDEGRRAGSSQPETTTDDVVAALEDIGAVFPGRR